MDEEEQKQLVRDSMARLYDWVKTSDGQRTPQVSFDIGVLMGRVMTLEKRDEQDDS